MRIYGVVVVIKERTRNDEEKHHVNTIINETKSYITLPCGNMDTMPFFLVAVAITVTVAVVPQ